MDGFVVRVFIERSGRSLLACGACRFEARGIEVKKARVGMCGFGL